MLIGVALIALWVALRRQGRPLPRRAGLILIAFYLAAWAAFLFTGFGGGYPLRPDGLDGVEGESPADDFAVMYLAPFGLFPLVLPGVGPSIPPAIVAIGVWRATVNAERRVPRLTIWIGVLLLVVPYVVEAFLSGEGNGITGFGS